jgi:hypothetical protein
MENQNKTGLQTGLGIVSLVVGILALLVSFIPCLGQFSLFVAPVGIVLGVAGYYTAKTSNQSSGLSLGGLFVSLLAAFIAWFQYHSIHEAGRAIDEGTRQMYGRQQTHLGDHSSGEYFIWGGILLVIAVVLYIYFMNNKKDKIAPSIPKATPSNVSGQLQKFHDLKEKGVITEEEFNEQKAKLLEPTNQQPVQEIISEQSSSPTPIEQITPIISSAGAFVAKYKSALIGAIAVLLIGYGGYYFLLKANPERDGKTAGSALCKCQEERNTALIKVNDEFISSFDTYNFKTQDEARNKLGELQTKAVSALGDCDGKARMMYTDLRAKFLSNPVALEKFDFVYNGHLGTCTPTNLTNFNEGAKRVNDKIAPLKSNNNPPDETDVGGFATPAADGTTSGNTTASSSIDNRYLVATYYGTIGKKNFELLIESSNGSEFEGYDIAGGNKRPVKGEITNKRVQNNDMGGTATIFSLDIKEPGDNQWDGEFFIDLWKSDQAPPHGTGNWVSYKGGLRNQVIINTDHNEQSEKNSSTGNTQASPCDGAMNAASINNQISGKKGKIVGSQSYFYNESCLKNQTGSYLVKGDEIIIDQGIGNAYLAHYVSSSSKQTKGWLNSADVRME